MTPVYRYGTHNHAAFVVFERCKRLGITGLKLALLVAVARMGGHCWRKNSDLAEQLGTAWHQSIWRVAHQLSEERLLRLVRVLPGKRPPNCETRYPEGRSSKTLDFRRLGCPEAIEDWRRPDTAAISPNGRSGAPKRPPRKRSEPIPRPKPLDTDLTPAEYAAAAAAALASLPPPKR